MSELAVRHLPGPEMRRGTVGTGARMMPTDLNPAKLAGLKIEGTLDILAVA